MAEHSNSNLMTRRGTLQFFLAGGALIATMPYEAVASERGGVVSDAGLSLSPFVKINPDNSMVIGAPCGEMGQGTFTSIPLILAEELDADWEAAKIEFMPLSLKKAPAGDGNAALPGYSWGHVYQGVGGSHTVRRVFEPLRRIGAGLRVQLVSAAAKDWNVPKKEIRTEKGMMVHGPSDRRAPYSAFVRTAAELGPLSDSDIALKSSSDFRLVGKPHRIKGAHDIVTGAPVFGIDQSIDGMLHAVLERSPHFQGTPKSVDSKAARAVKGVRDVITIPRSWEPGEGEYHFHGAVAVVADSLWSALKASRELTIEWENPFTDENTASQEATLKRVLDEKEPARNVTFGDVDKALESASQVVEAEYLTPPHTHICMEPHSAIADIRDGYARVIIAHQFLDRVAMVAAKAAGIDPTEVIVEQARMGGGFGRKFDPDFASEAIWLSKRLNRPVKVTWTRENDIRNDCFNPAHFHRFKGGLDAKGNVVAWDCQASALSRRATRFHNFPTGLVPNLRVRGYQGESGMWYGPWRGPVHNMAAFAIQGFMDELAHAAGVDPLTFRLRMLDGVEPIEFGDWGADVIEPARMAAVLRLAAEKAGWGSKPSKGVGRGLAGYFTFGGYCAHVVDVSVDQGEVKILRVVSAVDCGQPVNTLGIAAQIEGGALDGFSTALYQAITIENGQAVEGNLDTYRMMRIDNTPPDMEVHIVPSSAPPTGTGEISLPPAIPALTNAIFDATGVRIRRLPIADQLKI